MLPIFSFDIRSLVKETLLLVSLVLVFSFFFFFFLTNGSYILA